MMFPLQYLNALEVVSTVPHKMANLYEKSILKALEIATNRNLD